MHHGLKIHGIVLKVDVTPIIASYFIFKACNAIGTAVLSKAVCDHLDEIKDFVKDYKKDDEPAEE